MVARISSHARALAWLATSPSARGMAPVLPAPRRVHGLGRNLRWQQAQSPGLLNCDIAPLPLPPLGRQWFFASEEAAADVACNVQLVPPAPPSARSEALSLASTLKKRVTKMNKHKARKRRKRDRMKKRTN